MAKRQQLPKRLFKGQDRISAYQKDQSPAKLMKQVSREHPDLLQNIEFVLVTRFHEDPGMDDRAASEALRACLGGAEPVDPRVAELVAGLQMVREFRATVSDDLWHDALRVVDDSVHRHSDLAPGRVDYLSFVAQYVR